MRSKAYSFKCKSGDEIKNKVKGVFKPQSEHTKLHGIIKSSHGEDYQKECDNYILRSPYLEIYLQKNKSTLPLIDYKRCYEKIIRS